MDKKWPTRHDVAQPSKAQTTHGQNKFMPAVAQAKLAAVAPPRPATHNRTPGAPPVYRPEVKPAVAQQKPAAPPQTQPRPNPSRPPTPTAQRPGGAPNAVQFKAASSPPHAARLVTAFKRPGPPAVYNPQPAPRVLQAKESVARRAGQAGSAPPAPAVFRPHPLPKCLQMKSAAPPAYKPPPPHSRGLQLKRVAPAYGPLSGVVQRVKIYGKDVDGGTEEIADLKNSKVGIRDYVKAAADLSKVGRDFKTSLDYCDGGVEKELLEFGLELVNKKLGVPASGGPPPPPVDLSIYKIGAMSLPDAKQFLAEWAANHPKSKGAVKAAVDEALLDIEKVAATPSTLKAVHDKIAAVIVQVHQAQSVKGASSVTPEQKKAAKKQKAKVAAKAAVTPEQEFEAYADHVIADIEKVRLTGNRGLDLSEPSASTANADSLANALYAKYHNTPAEWAPGEDVRYYIVRGPGTKIDITGHEWKDGMDVSIGSNNNVFNYHLNW